MAKKGQTTAIATAIGSVVLLMILGIMLAVNANVVQNVQQTQITNTAGCNSTVTSGCGFSFNISGSVLSGMTSYGNQQTTIWLVTAIGLVIAILLGAFAFVRLTG